MKRIFLIGLALVMVCSLLACGKEQGPSSQVKEYFKAAKEFDLKEMEKTILPSRIEALKKNMGEVMEGESKQGAYHSFLKNAASKMKVTVLEEKIEGEEATVSVKVEHANAGQVLSQVIGELFAKSIQAATSGKEMSSENMASEMDELIKKHEQTELPMVEKTFDITCAKEEGKWYIKEINGDMMNTMLSGMMDAFDNLGDQLKVNP